VKYDLFNIWGQGIHMAPDEDSIGRIIRGGIPWRDMQHADFVGIGGQDFTMINVLTGRSKCPDLQREAWIL
jgi:hypothetical protein